MLRRFAAVSSAALLILSACSGSDDAGDDTGDASTTTAPTTTSPGDAGSATSLPPAEPAAGTPPAVLDSFTASTNFRVEMAPSVVDVTTTGTYVDGSFSCTTNLNMDGNDATTQVISTPEGVHVDTGSGFTEVTDDTAANSAAGCPADPAFWSGFTLLEIPEEVTREPVEINGVPAHRVDLLAHTEVASELGLVPDIEGASYDELTMAFADDGEWLIEMSVVASLTAEAAAQAFGMPSTTEENEGATITMQLDIGDPDDPSLTVERP